MSTCRACHHDRDRHGPEAGGCIECRCSDTFVRRIPLSWNSAGDLLGNDEPCMCGTEFTCMAEEHWACGFCEGEGCDWCHHLPNRERGPESPKSSSWATDRIGGAR
ncbi:MAG: hypothetical protein ACXVXW_07570 [Mycobacteriaceae bacterium]